ncbi:hypothetical protein GCM10008024_00110 [Allgaiera indica]|uniref:Uncharacterized protein n=1 Tax=Allgaiera indica TaxID=765699 RepID=A0AAN4ZWY8_9RHOB|nr:hypothetical protein GCM10008024_00110 [Allgaiera indica]SDW54587.1 hypothetical protein SAMN05444006_104206 [Allgaiera indica]
MIRALRELRGVGCPYCGHNTRVFSSHCGLCHRRKPFARRLPLILLYLAIPLLALATYLVVRLTRSSRQTTTSIGVWLPTPNTRL